MGNGDLFLTFGSRILRAVHCVVMVIWKVHDVHIKRTEDGSKVRKCCGAGDQHWVPAIFIEKLPSYKKVYNIKIVRTYMLSTSPLRLPSYTHTHTQRSGKRELQRMLIVSTVSQQYQNNCRWSNFHWQDACVDISKKQNLANHSNSCHGLLLLVVEPPRRTNSSGWSFRAKGCENKQLQLPWDA